MGGDSVPSSRGAFSLSGGANGQVEPAAFLIGDDTDSPRSCRPVQYAVQVGCDQDKHLPEDAHARLEGRVVATCRGASTGAGTEARAQTMPSPSQNTILHPATASAFILFVCAVPRYVLSCLIWLYSLVF